MAKKVVATLKQEGGKKYAKIIKAVKSEGGSYAFKTEIIDEELVQEAFKK